jgi:hypothetical protein
MSFGWMRDAMTSAPWAVVTLVLLTVFMVVVACVIIVAVTTWRVPADARPSAGQAASEILRAFADVLRVLFGRRK